MRVSRIGTALALASFALLTVHTAVAAYGPIQPLRPPAQGGFSAIIASKTIARRGGTLRVKSGRTVYLIVVPRGALSHRVQLTLTKAQLSGLRKLLPKRDRLLLGFGLEASRPSGAAIHGLFSKKPVTVTVVSRAIKHGLRVFRWAAARHRFVHVAAVIGRNRLRIRIRGSGDFVIVAVNRRRGLAQTA